MTLQTLNTYMAWPENSRGIGGTPAITNAFTLDAAAEYVAYVYQAREAMTISHVGWRTGNSAVGSPTADTRIETVGADGVPTGTLWDTNTNIVSGALSANTFTLHALTASASISKGQFFAVVILYQSGTSFNIAGISNIDNFATNVPYQVTNVSGSAVKARPGQHLVAVAGSGATSFYRLYNFVPITAFTAGAFNNTNSAARGLRFKVPFKCRCVGIRWFNSNSNGDFNAVMYDDAGAELSSSSTAIDGNHSAETNSAATLIFFDSAVTLSPDTWYRAAIEPSSATNVTVGFWTLPSADYLTAYPGGTNSHYTTRASGTWDDSGTDKVPLMDILIDQLDDGVATVAPQHGNMTGGMQ